MAGSSVPWSTPARPRTGASAAVIVSLVAILGAVVFFWRSAGPSLPGQIASASQHAPAPLSAWRIDVEASKSNQKFGGRFMPGNVFFVPAGAAFNVRPDPANSAGYFVELPPSSTWDHEGGEINPPAGGAQSCRAPQQPGLYKFLWRSEVKSSNEHTLEVFVLSHAETQVQGDRTIVKVNGKSIGAYHDPEKSTVRRVRENANQYRVPQFFATLNKETIPLKLGPDFDLGDLVAFKDYKGPDGRKVFTTTRHTDVLALRPDLIDKLIKLRERLRSKGVKVTKFWVTSGFRTPDYNKSIGGAAYSRHCYGDAVDICIDEDNDKHMDDLNGDGKLDRKDGIIIGNACRELELEGAVVPGGIGVYEWDSEDSVRSHVHIDCRGYISRWGQDGSGRYKKSFIWWPKAEFNGDDGE
ncbi:MAG TPA: D-Ala-D-Ala carboxypeptidase family metallohydrolase [Planctomycetota bacterium]|nr:D-Ala-D-Ala carboxypeptidase family metallohydrolase [Planctomycetota bacterium]